MQSKVLDTISVVEKYNTTSGVGKSRTTTIKSMTNGGSLFVNIHSGRGSVNVSEKMLPKIAKALTTIKFVDDDKMDKISMLEKEITLLKLRDKQSKKKK